MYYTDILRLADSSYYTGFSSNLKNRIAEHVNGDVPQTRRLRPVSLAYYCAFPRKKLALDFEKYLKTHSGFAFRQRHLI